MVRMAKDQIRRLSRDDLDRVFQRSPAFEKTIREMRRNIGELDDNIATCDIKEMLWSQQAVVNLAAATGVITREELNGGIEQGRGEPLPLELCYKIFDEVDDTHRYLMGVGKRAETSCECRRLGR